MIVEISTIEEEFAKARTKGAKDKKKRKSNKKELTTATYPETKLPLRSRGEFREFNGEVWERRGKTWFKRTN